MTEALAVLDDVQADTVREACPDDRDEIVELVARLSAESPYIGTTQPDPAHFSAQVDAILAHPQMVFLVAEREGCLIGLLGLTRYQHLLSGEWLAAELCWYVAPEHRGRVGLHLLRAAEQWATGQGCVGLQMLAPTAAFRHALTRRGHSVVLELCERRL